MAIDQNDLRSLNFARAALPFATAAAPAAAVPVFAAANGYSPHPWPYPYPSSASEPAPAPPLEEAGPSDHPSTSAARKVKFLCSFGGKILPRPSDGALRYVGGNTRIISIRKDASFGDLMQKMVDVYGGAVVLKYQLPDEDLDALVTVSCPEDLENMMEEYDKLVESAPEGSVKLRIFLFSPTEVDSILGFAGDGGGQKYVDAVNGVTELAGGGPVLRRRGSAVSMSSTQNSEGPGGGELSVDVGPMEGTSSAIQSPSVSLQDVPTIVFPDAIPNPSLVSVNAPGGKVAPIPQFMTDRAEPLPLPLVSTMPQQTATFTSNAYVEPNQEGYNYLSYMPGAGSFQFVNPQQLGTGGNHIGPHMGLVAVSPQYLPQMRITTGPLQQPPFQVGSLQPVPVMEGRTYQTMMMPVSTDANCKAHQNGPQLVPLPQTTIQGSDVSGGTYAWQQLPVPEHLLQGQALRPEDCQHLCKNDLPHAHSDSVIQEHASAPMGNISDAHMTYHSLQNSETMLSQSQRTMAALAPHDGVVEQKSEGVVVPPQPTRHVFSHFPLVQSISDGIGPQKIENLNQNMLHYPPEVAGFPSNLLPMYGLSSSHHPQVVPEIILHPQLQPSHTQGQQLYNQDILINDPSGVNVTPARNDMFQTGDFPYLGSRTELSSEFVRPIGVLMENLHVNSKAAGIDEPIKASIQPHPEILQDVIEHRDDSKDQAKEKVLLVKDTLIGPAILTERSTFIPAESLVTSASSFAAHGILSEGNFWPAEHLKPSTSAFDNTGIIPERISLKQPEHLVPFASEATRAHYVQPDSNRVELPPSINPSRLGIEPELPVPHKWLPATSNINNKTPVGDQKELFSQTNRGNAFNNILAPPVCTVPLPTLNLGGPNGTVGHAQESAFSNSFFNDRDPWGITQTAETTSLGQTANAHPLPKGLASGEPLILKDTCNEKYSKKGEQLNVDVFLGVSPCNQPSNIETKDLFPELVQQKKESAQEQLKNNMHSVEEGAPSDVFRPSISPPDFDAREECAAGVSDDVGVQSDNLEQPMSMKPDDNNLEDNDLRKSDKLNFGFPITDDISSIQIIKNSDLEELKELGSGTFGTVYHGKWKGSDVAIKRINDRCFAGKPSEQERLRADFWNEACNLADLHHPNVVAFYGVVLDGPGGSVATVTEFMVNGSLRNALLKNDKSLDKRKRLLIAMDAAFGMEYLHGKNIVHFDLKSDNLLVNLRDPHRPICKVGDLGLSKVKCQTLISGGVRGTLPWMAPELLNGSSSLVSEKVDVFSFGIVLWELLTGEEPYANLHYGAIIGGILSNTLRPSVPENCDPEWKSLMERCWSSEPSERPSFTEVARALRSITASLPQKGQAQPNSSASAQAHK